MILEGHELPKHVLVMVGLPARGKTYIARKIARYLSWLGYSTRTFNVGEYRRSQVGARQPASFFDPDDETNSELREAIAAQSPGSKRLSNFAPSNISAGPDGHRDEISGVLQIMASISVFGNPS